LKRVARGAIVNENLLPVTELRQWAYCPRVVYYHITMPGAGRSTYKMAEGLRAQELIESLEMRRTLREYGLEDATREFGLWLSDAATGLSGKLDLLLRGERTAAVVDFKLTSGEVGENHRMQLAGYAVLVERVLGVAAPVSFLFRIPDNKVFAVPVTDELRDRVTVAVAAIQRMRESQELPEPTSVRARCTECEYANYCGDVW
jgi:CRISPR-associated exonuclease Cas4